MVVTTQWRSGKALSPCVCPSFDSKPGQFFNDGLYNKKNIFELKQVVSDDNLKPSQYPLFKETTNMKRCTFLISPTY